MGIINQMIGWQVTVKHAASFLFILDPPSAEV